MIKAVQTIVLSILMTGMCYSPLKAQTTEAETAPPQATGSAADLEITPRVGAGYNSSAAGHDGFGRFEGFVPLLQNPGKDLLFLEGRLLLDNGANVGGNILVGYRAFNPELNRSFGGYIGYDNRDTGDSTFNQIGLGLESLGEIWDLRLNGYIPVGDTRQVVASSTFDTGFQAVGTPIFQGNSLLLSGERIFRSTTIQEAAMSGLDLELGAKIAEFANGGEVRGYGGVYYYDASGSPSTVGGKVRVEVKPTDSLNLGFGLQHDDLFGTNILFTVGGTFPGTRPAGYRQDQDQPESVWARMGESVSRTAYIVVDQQVESVSFTEQSNIVATNPATGQPWVFVHVTEGGNSDGTFESPFGTVQEGVGVAQSDGNHIVYVRSGAASGDTGPITIPALVQLLSAGVLQQVDTQEFGLVTLPFSNSGQLTNFTGTITMEDQSVLSGFNLTSNNGPGIAARNLSFVTIRDSNIVSSSEAALLLENTTGTIALSNTNLTGNGAPALGGTNINNLTFAGGSLTSSNSTTNGITLNGVSGALDISTIPIIITNPQGNGIAASNVTGSLNLANVQISGSAAEGILLQNSTGAIALQNSNVTSTGGAAFSLANTTGTVSLTNSNLTGEGAPALVGTNINSLSFTGGSLTSNNSTTNGITLDGVSGALDITTIPIIITNPQGNGIAASNVTGSLNLANAQISGSTAEGILLQNSSGAIAIQGSTVVSNGGAALSLANTTGDVTLTNSNLTGEGVAALVGTNINNLSFTGGSLTSNNSTTNGITLNGITGNLSLANGTITNSQAEAILVENSTGAIALSDFEITNSGSSGIAGTNLANVALTNNQITQARNRGIILEQVNGTVEIGNNTITGTVGLSPATPTAADPPTGQGIALFDLTGIVSITSNQITGTTGFAGNIDTINPDNSYRASGQGIAFLNNTAGQVDLNIADNAITDNANQGVALGNLSGTIVITDNTIFNTSGTTGNVDNGNPNNSELFTGEGIAFNNDTVQNVNLTIARNTLNNNTSRGISLVNLLGQVTIDDNEISDTQGAIPFDGASTAFPVGQGIAFTNDSGDVNLTISNNRILRNLNQGILLTDINGTVGINSNMITETRGNLAIININDFAAVDFSTLTSITNIDDFSDQAALDEMAGVIASDLPTGQGIVVANAPDTLNLTIDGNEIRDNHSQGIALDDLPDDTVTITGNTITGTSGAFVNNNVSFSTGQGILAIHANENLNLTISEDNQISDNFEDGIVVVVGDLVGGLTGATAAITIDGNRLTNNGVDTDDSMSNDIRGDGIRIIANGNPVVNSLNISNNMITGNRDDGIQVTADGLAQITTAISNNTINQNIQQGIFLGNVVTLGRIIADVQMNTLTGNGGNALEANPGALGNICLNLSFNNSNTDYLLSNNAMPIGGTLLVVNPINPGGMGPVTMIGALIGVPNCP
ncbi:MAG: hypothetical protein F6J96_32505 [Symploca sp. SIO1C2]|nr:hypothetical protein [Symploca sp. SIO1C2]